MKCNYGIAGIVLSAALTLPFAAVAKSSQDENENGNYSEQRGKGPGQGKGKGKHKEKHERKSEREGDGRSAAGGPPPWAPAHGWRRKGESERRDDGREVEYEQPVVMERGGAHVMVTSGNATVDVGIEQGTCNRDTIGAVVGGLIGGAIGNRVGNSDNRDISTVLGVVIGGVVGHEVGRSMDKADQHCTGQVLEQARDNQTVHWVDNNNSGQYSVTPLRTYQVDGVDCRDFVTEYQGEGGTRSERSSACRNSDGAWSGRTM